MVSEPPHEQDATSRKIPAGQQEADAAPPVLVSQANLDLRMELPGAQSSYIEAPVVPPAIREFWFNVNAELVIYGATEPDATVTLAGRIIGLRPDGTFSCRFALPDGHHEITASAAAADRSETRAATLKFSRSTDYRAEKNTSPPSD
jgi:hypothetical protein